ncbi:hypothetical protein MRGORDO_4 [Mycobacterium phage MrGordo]|uniref:Uncharacterized protein n=1 Tax=Mycobacterium phage MrGordo TaxID=2847995 RepID=G1DTP3_9CAUD|nr:hypothetical protein FGG31_gp04 [Mycobacterium phage MrGordon]AEJ92892.1 hypothetical protein MRGORDO_4 [Mycobacterium phage MrGordon]
MPEPTAVPGGVERSPSGAPPLGLPPRPGRNVPTEAVCRDDGGIGAQEPLQTPPKRLSAARSLRRLWAGPLLARQARPASNQERSPLAGMSSTGKRAHLYT